MVRISSRRPRGNNSSASTKLGSPRAGISECSGRVGNGGATSSPGAQLSDLSEPYVACAPDTPQDDVAALFDKYNLLTLAVVDQHERLAGIITADDVITMLRHR